MKFRMSAFGVLLSMFVGVNAYANVFVNWQASGGFFFSANTNIGILSLGESTIAQLIWSPDSVADPANYQTTHYVTGNDQWLADVVLSNNGGAFADYAWFGGASHNDGGAMPSGGFIYARIFENNNPSVGDRYYIGPIVVAQNLDPVGNPPEVSPDSPQLYNMNRNATDGDAIDGAFGAQVVPEPASISLLVLGAAVLGLRRRRR